MKAPVAASIDTQDESMNINNNNSNPTLPKPIKKRKLSKTQSQVYAKTTNFSESEILRLHRKFQVRYELIAPFCFLQYTCIGSLNLSCLRNIIYFEENLHKL